MSVGKDWASLALFSLAPPAGGGRGGPRTIAYQTVLSGEMCRVHVTLEPSGGVDLPQPADQLVLLALLQLATRDGDPPARLEFRRHEVVELLGWCDSGRNFERLGQALARLAALTVVVHSGLTALDGRVYPPAGQEARLLADCQLATGRKRCSRVTWGPLLAEAFALSDLKRLDWQLLLALGNPHTVQLYRLLDRVTLGGATVWRSGWRPLAAALGMGGGYDRPAKFWSKLRPHAEALARHGVLQRVAYERGGRLMFEVGNYLRAELRRALEECGVAPVLAQQVVAGHDEGAVMAQLDCWRHGFRPQLRSPLGLVHAICAPAGLVYPSDEISKFLDLWGRRPPAVRRAVHAAAAALNGLGGDPEQPQRWPCALRAVARFVLSRDLDPARLVAPRGAVGNF
jgi:hypothetical protein